MDVTAAMLADAASVSDGKLYIHGGGWNSLFTPQMPVVHPALALVVIFRLEWSDAHESIPFEIALLDADDNPIAPLGNGIIRSTAAPHIPKGSDFFENFATSMFGLKFENYGNYRFRISSNDRSLASVPLSVSPMSGMTVKA